MWDETEAECAALVWDIAKGTTIGPPLKHADGVLHAVFSPDGRKVLTASEDSSVLVRNPETGKALVPPLKHTHEVSCACFTPDGRWIATACRDRTARVWDAETGEPLTPPLKHPWDFRYVQLVDDGRSLLTRSSDGKTMLWKLRVDHHSINELTQLAQALSGQRNSWEVLKAQNAPDLVVSTNEIITWHTRVAEESESSGQWSAAEFHWKQLMTIVPGDNQFKERSDLARIKAQAEKISQ
jgi:WD40 repeat protein